MERKKQICKNVQNWRKRIKIRMIQAFHNKCCICEKTFIPEIYEFHHINASEKTKGLSYGVAYSWSWKRIVQELRKCIMVCANCHRLIEYGNKEIPKKSQRFDESFSTYISSQGRLIGK